MNKTRHLSIPCGVGNKRMCWIQWLCLCPIILRYIRTERSYNNVRLRSQILGRGDRRNCEKNLNLFEIPLRTVQNFSNPTPPCDQKLSNPPQKNKKQNKTKKTKANYNKQTNTSSIIGEGTTHQTFLYTFFVCLYFCLDHSFMGITMAGMTHEYIRDKQLYLATDEETTF